jgi:type IV secretory pathway VirB2 component (pilin)
MFKGSLLCASLAVLLFVGFAILADSASASTAGPGGGSGLQWETPIQTIVRSVSGPVAYGFAVLGLVALAVKFVFGGEMGDILRYTLNGVVALSILMFSVPLLGTLFAGAVIEDQDNSSMLIRFALPLSIGLFGGWATNRYLLDAQASLSARLFLTFTAVTVFQLGLLFAVELIRQTS